MYDEDNDIFDEDFDDEELDLEELIKLVNIDVVRKKKVHVKLIDDQGDEVELKDIVEQLSDYIETQFNDHSEESPSHVVTKLLPLATRALMIGLPKMCSPAQAYTMAAINSIRGPMINMMIVVFALLKFVQQKGFKIVTVEEDMSDEEIEEARKMNKISSIAEVGRLAGMSPEEVVKELVEGGTITKEEAEEMVGDDLDVDSILDGSWEPDSSDDDDPL